MSSQNKQDANYDPHLTSAEVAARIEREGENFRHLPDSEEGVDTDAGYTVDREGLVNNYAIEPEMYVNVPGDLKEKEEALKAERAQEIKEVNKEGGKGPGVI